MLHPDFPGFASASDLGNTALRSSHAFRSPRTQSLTVSDATQASELAAQRSPIERGRRLRARAYALDGDEAQALRLSVEFAGEELTDPEISRLIGIYRATVTRVLRFAA